MFNCSVVPQDDGVAMLNDGVAPQDSSIVPQDDGGTMFNDGVSPTGNSIVPQDDGVTMFNCGVSPQDSSVIPQSDGATMFNFGVHLQDDGAGLFNCGVRPSFDNAALCILRALRDGMRSVWTDTRSSAFRPFPRPSYSLAVWHSYERGRVAMNCPIPVIR